MTKAIVVHEYGGPDVLRYENIKVAAPTADEIRVKQLVFGVNFAEIHTREGIYPSPHLPHPIGDEAMRQGQQLLLRASPHTIYSTMSIP